MGEELIFFTTADMIEQQGESNNEAGGMGFIRKGAVAEKIVNGTVDVESLKKTINKVNEALNLGDIKESAFAIDEVEISLGINGKGQVGLIGTGVEMGAEASIKVVLKRNKS